MKRIRNITAGLAATALLLPRLASASSHMDAPLITLDPSANTTDVYAFVAGGEPGDTNQYLEVGLGVYPFEEPGTGPNKYNFDDNVLYQIHICTTNKAKGLGKNALNDLEAGRATLSYQFQFNTTYQDKNTILVSYLGVISNIFDASQNIRQTYSVTKIDHRKNNKATVIVPAGFAAVPPNNEGDATPFYNGGDGDSPAISGATNSASLDRYTSEAIFTNQDGYLSFAGQRDDGFYADVLSVFDLLQLRSPGHDSQKGYNIHEMELRIPLSELGGPMQSVGVYATTSRRAISVLRNAAVYTPTQLAHLDTVGKNPFAPAPEGKATVDQGGWVQVARQGNPLFNEVLVAVVDKDLYSRTSPTVDADVFAKYAMNPEPAALFKAIYNLTNYPTIESGRADIASIFIPDVIKVDLSTGPAHLQGNGTTSVAGYNNLSVFGGDVLTSKVTGGLVAGGWPNGRRYGDNVVDIALAALLNSTNLAATGFGLINTSNAVPFSTGVTNNDEYYNMVFPYEGTPQNGRNHTHD